MRREKNLKKPVYLILICSFLLSAYGYSGNLPELGKNTKDSDQNEVKVQQKSPAPDADKPAFPATKLFFPKIYSNYNISKYSDYLTDIKQVEQTLSTLRDVIKSDRPDKVQQFCAKVNVLDLYVDNLKSKYANKPERNYESYKQLIILDKYLMEAANYKRDTDKYRKNIRGSLASKLEDEAYLRQKINMSLNSIDSVLEIIKNARL